MLITTTCDLGNWPPNTWNRVNKLQHLHFDKAIKRRGKEKFKDVTHDYQKKKLTKAHGDHRPTNWSNFLCEFLKCDYECQGYRL